MIRVGEMSMRLDSDEAAESGARAIVERIFVKKIAGGVRRDVILQRASVEFLLVFCDCDSEQIASAAFADEPAQTFETRIFCSQMQIQAHRRRIVIDRRRVHL